MLVAALDQLQEALKEVLFMIRNQMLLVVMVVATLVQNRLFQRMQMQEY